MDGVIEFYTRIHALTNSSSVVLDYGAGRGQFVEDPVEYRHELRSIQRRVAQLVGADVDEAVLGNPSIDRAILIQESGALDLESESIDLVIADYVFEHIASPFGVAQELDRVLRPGGWVCARTPNRYGYIALASRAVPNRLHRKLLRLFQPAKPTIDTFDTRYRMNTRAALRKHFPANRFEHVVYFMDSEPAYFGNSQLLWLLERFVQSITPRAAKSMMFAFIRKIPT